LSTIISSFNRRSRADLLALWRRCLSGEAHNDPHEGVIQELVSYSQLPEEQVRWLSEHSQQLSEQKWAEADRSTPEGLHNFYQEVTSWIFGTLRYHADQALERYPPLAVEVALKLQHLTPGRYLDFGCGAGTASLFFHTLGWNVAMADISQTFIDFVRWRCQSRGIAGEFYILPKDRLPSHTYDLITAFDVMAHVPDIEATLRDIHRILKTGGYFVFNIDSRAPAPENAWFLYSSHHPIIAKVRRTGFKRHPKAGAMYIYQKVERSAISTALVALADNLRYNRFVTAIGNQIRRLKAARQ
jgi:2-polyprenyl-3-methyl-5-hydroxy-6-metoxy-1,4-benzoquinol methylase